jgi:twitching motility protein PilT
VTLEDPIEVQLEERQAIINQREIGVDTRSFTEGLKNVLRQSPDVLFLSDLRDRETMEAALFAAESGQLVITCIHTTSAAATIERIVATFPANQHGLIRYRVSLVLKGVLSLHLLPRRDGAGQVPACEILIMTPTIRELIREGRPQDIPPFLHDGALQGMQTMTQALHRLVQEGTVSVEAAMQAAEHPEELELALRGIRGIRDVHR